MENLFLGIIYSDVKIPELLGESVISYRVADRSTFSLRKFINIFSPKVIAFEYCRIVREAEKMHPSSWKTEVRVGILSDIQLGRRDC